MSAGNRFTLYALDLVPGDPTTLRLRRRDAGDDRRRTSRSRCCRTTAPSRRSRARCGRATTARCSTCRSAGPTEKAYTMRDANLDNTDVLEQFFGMATATSLDEFIEVHDDGERHPVGQHDRDVGRRARLVRRRRGDAEPVRRDDRGVAGRGRRRRPGRRRARATARSCSTGPTRERMGRRPGGDASGHPAVLRSSRSSSGPTTCSTPTTRTGSPTRTSC